MSAYLASFVPALANHIWQSTAFAAAAWLLTILLRKNSARVRYGIWLAASIKFLIPFSLLIAVGGLLPKPRQVVAPAVYTAMQAAEQPFADISAISADSLPQAPTLTQRIAADLPAALLALWLVGTVTLLIIWFRHWRKASIDLRDAAPATNGRELEILRSLEARLSMQDCAATSRQPHHLAEKAGLGRASFGSHNQHTHVWALALEAWPRLRSLFRRLLFSGTRIGTPTQKPAPLGAAQLSPARQGWVLGRKTQSAVGATQAMRARIVRAIERAMPILRRSPLRLALSSKPTEPSIYGIFRPVLVWPRRLSDRLSDDHIEAIMAHELAHARRFDNATAALHMLVEAAFWFHPLVWWMERRMIEERERACDEAVISFGGSPDAYAEGILETCRFCVAPGVACVSGITGADLRNRVVSIMMSRVLMRMTWPKKLLIGCAALCIIAAPVLLGQMNSSDDWEKAAGDKMSFEVASVKEDSGPKTQIVGGALGTPVRPSSNVPLNSSDVMLPNGGLFSATNTPLLIYIGFAYKLSPSDEASVMSQLPKWANEERFDIQAKAAGSVSKDQMRLMMQSLLADRFKLAIRKEAKEEPVYDLVPEKPGKLGPQIMMQPASVPCSAAAPLTVPDSVPATLAKRLSTLSVLCGNAPRSLPTEKPGVVSWAVGRDLTAAQLAGLLSVMGPNRPVIDQTGISEKFDFVLYWEPQPSVDAQPEFSAPPFTDALKDQLGLKLAPSTGQVETFVVDHIEEPTPN